MLSELYILKGKNAGKFIKLGNDPFVFLGRSMTNQVPIDDSEVSRVHARIEVRPNGCVLKDLSSGNGTYINDERTYGEKVLEDGDEIRIGKTLLKILIESEQEAQDWADFVGEKVASSNSASGQLQAPIDSPAYTGATPTPEDNAMETVILPAVKSEGSTEEAEAEALQPTLFSSEAQVAIETSTTRGKKTRVSLRNLIPGYLIERKLSTSRMSSNAIIYKAFQKSLERSVAIKTLLAKGEDREELVSKFMKEVARVARLPHSNIVVIHDAGRLKNFHYFVMEFLAGGSIEDLVDDGRPLSVKRALRLAHEIAGAVAYIHDHGIVHRGIGPGAILLDTATGTSKLCGFGFSKELDVASGDTTYLTAPLNGFAYLSPEQILGEQTSPAVDVYSLGATLYTMLSGRKPFEGKSHVALSQSIIDGSYEPLKSLVPELPDSICQLVETSMQRDPTRRFESARAFAESLRTARIQVDPDGFYRRIDTLAT